MNNKKVRILPARIYVFDLEEISYQSYGNSLSTNVQYIANHQTAISLSIAKLANRHVDDAIFFAMRVRPEDKRGIEPGSSDPKSSPLPLRHRGGHLGYITAWDHKSVTIKAVSHDASSFMGLVAETFSPKTRTVTRWDSLRATLFTNTGLL